MAVPKGWKKRFLKALADTAIVRVACSSAGIERSYAYKSRAKDKEFAAAWDLALEDAADAMEAEALRRATRGVKREKPIFYKGVQIGSEIVTEYSDGLLTLLMKAHRPHKFRERVDLTVKQDLTKLSDEELQIAFDLAQKLSVS
jgi:hypothetical protein